MFRNDAVAIGLRKRLGAGLVLLAALSLMACAEKDSNQVEVEAVPESEVGAALPSESDANLAAPNELGASDPAATQVEQPQNTDGSTTTANALDLSLPEDYRDEGARDLSEEELRRYQTDEYFNRQEEERRLKLKSKVFVKDGTTLEGVKQDYRGALDGGEIGVEYKTK